MNSVVHWILKTELGRRIEIQVLMNLVTSSLHLPCHNLLCMPSDKSLDIFAAFTAERLESCNHEQKQMLHAKALRLGRRLRLCLIHRDNEALESLIFLLYRNIGIKMEGHFPGKVIVSKCHFCNHYSPHICNVASLMDSGVICGVFGGGIFEFYERITEGNSHCLYELAIAHES